MIERRVFGHNILQSPKVQARPQIKPPKTLKDPLIP